MFKFWGTYGFPAELTELIVEEAKMKVDWEAYHQEEEKYRLRSKAQKDKGDFRTIQQNEVQALKKKKVQPTDSKSKYVENEKFKAKLVAIWDGDNFIDSVDTSDKEVALILDRTNYYYESGGQMFDIGLISGAGNLKNH